MAVDKEGAKKVVDQAGHGIDDAVQEKAKQTGLPVWVIWMIIGLAVVGIAKLQGWV